MTEASQDRVVLLFCHGGSFTNDCWNPIIRRLQESLLLKRVPCEIATFNWRFHGEKRDRSIEAKVLYRNGDKNCPRVDHPLGKFTEWGPPMVREEVAKLRADDEKLSRRTCIIGIGHSMGATSLMLTEIESPGTFDGIIMFEPPFNDGSFGTAKDEPLRDALVRTCLVRKDEWDTWEDMMQHLKTSREFRRWDSEVLVEFLKQGVEKTEDGKRWRLVVSPKVEGALYSSIFARFLAEDFAKAKCKIILEHAQHTVFFHEESIKQIAKQLKGQFIISDVIPKSTHSVCVELPAVCADRILKDLPYFPVFQETKPASKL